MTTLILMFWKIYIYHIWHMAGKVVRMQVYFHCLMNHHINNQIQTQGQYNTQIKRSPIFAFLKIAHCGRNPNVCFCYCWRTMSDIPGSCHEIHHVDDGDNGLLCHEDAPCHSCHETSPGYSPLSAQTLLGTH